MNISGAELPLKTRRRVLILMLGGTDFMGSTLVTELLARGHTVTLFNRGRANPHLFPDLEKIRGDRIPVPGDEP